MDVLACEHGSSSEEWRSSTPRAATAAPAISTPILPSLPPAPSIGPSIYQDARFTADAMASLNAIRSAAHAMAVETIEEATLDMDVPWRSLLSHEVRTRLETVHLCL